MSKNRFVLTGLLLCCAFVFAGAETPEPAKNAPGETAVIFPRPLRSVPADSANADSANAYSANAGLSAQTRPAPGSVDHPAHAALSSVANDRRNWLLSGLSKPGDLDRVLTRYYINQISGAGGLEWLRAVMVRAGPYLGFIRREIEERGLPEELVFLPVIESNFLSTAVSRSGAAGLWQFMKNSVGPFNMKINDWVDERRDFWKSTEAALQKLSENYNYFHDWPLALAAYNAGLGAVSAVVRNSGVRDYWVLSERKLLKTETIHYVPKLLAVAHILSRPREYGLVLWPENQRWTRIAVDRPVDLNLLAREAGLDAAALKTANQELSYAITPPDKGYLLKIPEEYAEKAAAVLARKDLPLINYYIHTIRSGDTLLALATYYGITVEQISAMNPGTQPRLLRIGGTLMIPALRERAHLAPTVSREPSDFGGTHLVKRGESLWSISLAYGVDPESLAEANNMGLNDILREGRILKTPIQ